MRAVLFFVLVCGFFAFSQASAIKTRQSRLNTCEVAKIEKLMDKIVSDTADLKTDLHNAYVNTLTGVVKCVFTSIRSLETCVEDTVEKQLEDLENEGEDYEATVEKIVNKIRKYMEECV